MSLGLVTRESTQMKANDFFLLHFLLPLHSDEGREGEKKGKTGCFLHRKGFFKVYLWCIHDPHTVCVQNKAWLLGIDKLLMLLGLERLAGYAFFCSCVFNSWWYFLLL